MQEQRCDVDDGKLVRAEPGANAGAVRQKHPVWSVVPTCLRERLEVGLRPQYRDDHAIVQVEGEVRSQLLVRAGKSLVLPVHGRDQRPPAGWNANLEQTARDLVLQAAILILSHGRPGSTAGASDVDSLAAGHRGVGD